MPAQEVGEAFVAIRATAAGFAQQARTEVNAALAPVRESANVQIRAQVDQTGARAVQQSFQPVVAGARQMGSEVEKSYGSVGESSHHAYERVQLSHDGIRARFGETLRAASAMGGGIALAYGAFSQVRQALTATNELAHSTNILTQATGLSARQASAWISIAQAQGISSTQLQTSFNGLSRATDSAQQSFAKAAATQSASLGKIHAEQLRVTSDQIAYTDALTKYGQGSHQAAAAAATLASAQNTLQQYTSGTTASLSTSAAAFARLGITESQLKSVQGDLPAELSLIADKFQSMGAGTDRATIAQQLFGRGSSVLIPILAQGSAGIQKNIDVATQYGATLSGPTLAGMERLRVEQQQLSLEMEGLRVRVATALEPILISVGLVAIRVASQFGNILAGGIHLAKAAMDAFLQTPYGQGLSTIAGDAIRFADQVRQHFQQTLERPLRFSRLFDSFKSDLLNWLPGATREFWTQLNSDLFAPGREITVPIKGRITMQQEHGAQIPTQQLTGAGVFPGSNFSDQGKVLGEQLFAGIMTALSAAAKSGHQILSIVGSLVGRMVDWVVSGGGAAIILSGALRIAAALVNTIFDPKFWIANWQPILDLALVVFSDGFANVGKGILRRLGAELSGPLTALLVRLFDRFPNITRFLDFIGAIPGKITDLFLGLGDRIANALNLGGIFRRAFDAVYLGALRLPGRLLEALRSIPDDLGVIAGSARQKLENLLDVGLIGHLILSMLEFVARLGIADIIRTIFVGFGSWVWNGISSGVGWLENQVVGLFNDFIRWIEGVLGISSPSRVAAGWGRDIVLGVVNGLKGLPVIGTVFRVEFAVIETVVRLAISRIRNIFDGIVGYVRAWANLVGDLIHGRWDKIMSDLVGIVRAGVRLFDALMGGIPGEVLRIASAVGRAAQRVGTELVNGAVNQAKKLPGEIRTQVEHVGQMISGLQGWLIREGIKIGSAILNGVINGVKSLPGKLGGALKDAAGGALSDVAGWAGIGSPSKRFQDEIGTPINDGIVKGLDPLRNDLTSAIIPVMNRILNTAGTQGHGNGRDVGTGITTGITGGLSGLRAGLQTAIVSASNAAMAGAKKSLGISSPSRVYAEQIGKPLADGIIAGMGGLEQGLVKKVTAAAQAAQAASGGYGGGSSTPSGSAAVGHNQALGRSMMLAHGWGADQWGALQALWTRESGWNQFAKNASSGAYGIPQSLPANKMASAGADYLTNPVTQIRWGLDYIAGRYGSPGGAWAHEESAGWYHGGGVVQGPAGANVPIMARSGEVVFTPEQMKMLAGRGSVNVGSVNIFESQDGRRSAQEFLSEIADRIGH